MHNFSPSHAAIFFKSAIFFFFFFFFFLLGCCSNAQEHICRAVKCSHGSPEINFPFIIQHHQPQHCGFPGFVLTCKSNTTTTTTTTTTIKFPSFRRLTVNSISYVDSRVNLGDPKNCIHDVFLNLNLSETPFRYYHSLRRYTYLNCSGRLDSAPEIPCLSTSRFHVYTVDEDSNYVQERNQLCRVVKTVEIPFMFNPYLSDNSFGLELTWDLGWKNNTGDHISHHPSLNNITRVSGVGFFILVIVVTIGIFVKIRHSKKTGDAEDHQLYYLKL